MNLLAHQVKYASGYKDKAFLVHEGGTGKTVCACVWLRDKRDKDALVISEKRTVDKWKQALTDWQTKATVVSKEQFKKMQPQQWSAIVVDEADNFASPLFTRSRSQLSEALYNQVRAFDVPIALLTATPIRSSPWNLHSLLCFLGVYIYYKDWRDQFFSLESRPFLDRPAWFPKATWRKMARETLERHADIVLFSDCVGDMPSCTEQVLKLESRKYPGNDELNATASFVHEHKFEQQDKHKRIVEIGKEYRKVLVVAYYVEQVEALAKELSKDRQVYMVHGGTKNQEAMLKQANADDECYLVIQASLGVGFDADSFSCVVFASMSYKVRDYVQMKYRVRRIHNLHPVVYLHLHAGECDRQVYNVIQLGKDFVPSEYATRTTKEE
jgi:superfamily II DNA or RNA helicase